jgi:hypothetical protein
MTVPVRSKQVFFRATEAEVSLFRASAEAEGLRLSEWLRRSAKRRAVRRLTSEAAEKAD